MEQSPLTLSRPAVLEPKIVKLFEDLLDPTRTDLDHDRPDAFWRELFFLRIDPARLRNILDATTPRQLLACQVCMLRMIIPLILGISMLFYKVLIHPLQLQCQQFVAKAIEHIDAATLPSAENALDVRPSPIDI